MTERKSKYQIPVLITILGKDEYDAIQESHNALQDGLIEPGFVEDAMVDPEGIIIVVEESE